LLVVICLADRILVEVEWQVPLMRLGLFNMRSGEPTRRKWRIPDGKVGERYVVMFGAPKVVAPPVLIKARVSWALRNKHRLCTGSYEIYGVPQT
jgi:hypothetical protein